MAEKRQFLDVWIVESNTVYKEVPFTVVSDWIQQGRLLDNDMVRPSGKGDWASIAETPALLPYVPKLEPTRPQDQAEALEAVGLDFAWKRHREDEDDDVDMIPLIDVSLVLLIFFMMTAAAGVGVASFVPTYTASNPTKAEPTQSLVINIDLARDPRDRSKAQMPHTPLYSIVVNGKRSDKEPTTELTELLKRVDEALGNARQRIEVTYNAHEELEDGKVIELLKELERRRGRILVIHTGVRG